jgi:hypothetical protein
MPSSKFEPINHLGRALGIGWSDGYNECQSSYIDRLSQLKAKRPQVFSQSQLYEAATFPPAQNLHLSLPLHSNHRYHLPQLSTLNDQPSYASPVIPQPIDAPHNDSAINPQPALPAPDLPIAPNQDALSPIPNTFVPLDNIPNSDGALVSPSDLSPTVPLELPRYEPEQIPAQPNDSIEPIKPPASPGPTTDDDDLLLIPEQTYVPRTNRPRKTANRYTPALPHRNIR